MENGKRLAELLFPHISKTPEYYESKYPVRDLKEGARVTRFAPSPTGFLHFGNLFTCLISYKTAKARTAYSMFVLKTQTKSAK